ncbi:hypothetical protein EG68_10166 [Paragonimus skrjabini miyazakii]|uniref:Uncharacterized protein n=1 Tax=Paragonimus skrjabini miyazakii TaxID=59628 RepID=A0A8S9Y8G8_9TREM|nr:hypothetical protein EG68_10166 [Paragonimus skrjabini miyazakii]
MSAERNPDSKSASLQISKEDGSRLPCISEQLGLWEVNPNVYRDLLDDPDVATCLVRCYSVTSRTVRRRTTARVDSKLNLFHRTALPYYAHNTYNFLYSCWQYLRVTIDSWCPPSASLVAYSVAQNKGCPWQVGYLTSADANNRVICLVTVENVEVIDLVNKSDHVLLSNEGTSSKEDHVLLVELMSEDNSKPAFKVQSSSLLTKSPIRRSSRWFLRYTDPWPQWRYVAYSPLYTCGDDLSRFIAIGYSNGSVEVIDLMAVENERQNEKQTSIFISSPVVLSNSDPRASLCPIVHITFLDRNHMFVCHFNGHVDFWYLDWQTVRFSARLMTRLYCEQIIPENLPPSPLTAAAYDSDSKTLVLSVLSSRSLHPSSLHKSLGLYCFRVKTGAPYLELVPTAKCTADPLTAGGVLSKLRYGKGMLVQWLTSAVRHIHQSVPSEMDGVSFLQTHKSKGISVVAALQCSGTCSVWSLPQLSPLFIVIGGCSTPSVESVVSRDPSQPFRLTWWRVPCVRDGTPSPDSPVISDDSVQLVVLRQNGELCILHFENSEVDKLTLDEKQVHELNLSPYSSFAYIDPSTSSSLSGSVLLLDQKASTDVLWKSVLYGERSDTKRHIIRAIRLAATTPSELYNHLILKGCYQDAIELASRHHHDVEWVYQQQWLDLSSRPSSLSEFRKLIDSTLALIRLRPVWVLKQCLSFLPSCADSTEFTLTGRIFLSAMRNLLEHGMTRLADLPNASLQEPVRIRLVRRLFHLDCLSEILSMEVQSDASADSASDPLDRHYFLTDLNETLEAFRRHSILDVALGYAHAGRFSAVKILINRLPITLGRHRLAILSSLCETVNPVLYAKALLVADFPVTNEPNFVCQPELESEAVDRLYSSLLPASFSGTELLMSDDGSTDSDIVAYVKQLAAWVVCRSRQIEARSGLVSHALNLIEIGEEVCLRLLSQLVSSHQLDQCLTQMSMFRLEFTQFAKIVYHNSKETRFNPARSNVSVRSKSRPIPLARFHFSHYMSLCLEDRIDIMVQVGLRPSKSHTQQLKSDSQSVLIAWCQLLIYILHVGNSQRNYKHTLHLITHSLSRAAFHHGFELHAQLLTCLESGTFHDILRNAAPPNWNHLASWMQLSPDSSTTHRLLVLDKLLLTGLLETLMHYQSRSHLGKARAGSPPNLSERDLQAPYLKEVTHIITLMSRCVVTLENTCDPQSHSDETDATYLSQRLLILSQCASAMSELVQLATSLEHQLGDTVRLGISSVGELVRCSSDCSKFQRFLAHWIAFITSLARKQSVALETHPSGLLIKPINEYVRHLRDILQKAFEGCPAERWLSTGLQYSLLTAGEQQLVDVAKYLQFDTVSSTVTLNERQLQNWCLCLLHALRNYVNTSVPQSSILPGSKSKSTDLLDPNERMARHCLSLFRFSCSRGEFNQNISQVFEVEECLLNASAFLSSVAGFVPNAGQNFPTVPFRLRSLWTRSENNFKRRRSLFSVALLCVLESFRHSHSSRRKFLELLKSDALYRTGGFFLLDAFTTAGCLTQTCYQYLATKNDHLLPVEVLDRTLELLLQAAYEQHSFAWLTCALWSSHFVEDHGYRLSISRLSATDNWTVLHSLFRIPRPSASNHSSTGRITGCNSQIAVELFRVWLLRFATSHCPASHTVDLYQDLATGWYRLECELTTNMLDDRWELPPILQPLLPSFQSLLYDRISQHCSVNFIKVSTRLLRYHDGVPYIYLPVDSCVGDILSPLLATKDLNYTVSLCERNWWSLFLRSWMFPDASGPVCQRTPKTLIYGPDVVSSDVRLSLCYAVLRSKVLILNPPTNLDPFTSCPLIESPHHTKTAVSKFEQPTFTDRLQLVSRAFSIAASRQKTAHLLVNGCFSSGSDLLTIIKEPLSSDLPKSLTTQLQTLCWDAVYKCLCTRAMTALPNIDLNRFNQMDSYKLDTTRRLARTNLSLGLCLALHAQLPLRDALYCRLASLFLDVSLLTKADQMEIQQLVDWVCKSSDACSHFVNWCETFLYPSIEDVEKMNLLFNILSSSVSESSSFASIPIRVHKHLLFLIKSDTSCVHLLQDVSYANLVSLLRTPLHNASEFGSFADHPLLPFLISEPVVCILSKALSLFAKSTTTAALCSGDLYAMYGLQKCTNFESCEAYRKQYGSLMSLLSQIAPAEDHSSYRRLLGWVKQLMFRTHAKLLKVDQRRWLLTEVIQFLEQRSVGASAHAARNSDRLDTLKRVSMYLVQFDLVVSQLGSVCFPKWSGHQAFDNEHQSVDETELPTGFYAALLVIDPDEPLLTVDLINHLIDVVCLTQSDSDVDQLSSTLLNKIEWLTHNLSLCLRVMNVSGQDQLNLITRATKLLEIPLPSPFERVLDDWLKAEQIAPTFAAISSHLVAFVRSCVEAPQTGSDIPRINQLLGAMLCDPRIRRVYGYQFWSIFKPTENHALFESEQPCGLAVLQSAVLFLTAQPGAFTKSDAVAVFIRNLSTLSSDFNVDAAVESLLEACVPSVTDELTKPKPTDRAVISSVSDFIQTVIELTELLFNDDAVADCSVRSLSHETGSSGNDAQLQKKLWSLWFNFGIQSELFLISDGYLARELLLDQWIKYGCSPPQGLAFSGLFCLRKYLQSNKDEHSDGRFSWPLCLLTTVYSTCLLQPNRDLVLQSLTSLSQQKNPMIESRIDLEACRFFVLSHGDLFTDLVQHASLSCLTLFDRVFTAIDLYLRQCSSQHRCHLFGSHCLRLLREADLWVEATRLACSVYGCPMEHVSLETLIDLITQPKTV